MTIFDWTQPLDDEANVIGGRLAGLLNSVLRLRGYSVTSAMQIAMTELLGTSSGVISVKAHGAVGDGVTDDSAAIARAVAAASSRDTIYFPPGTYLVTSGVTIGGAKTIQILGSGKDTTYINFNPPQPSDEEDVSTFPRMFVFDGGAADVLQYRSSLRDLSIYSDHGFAKVGIEAIETEMLTVEDVIVNFSGNSDSRSICMYARGRHMGSVNRCRFDGPRPLVFGNPTHVGAQLGLDHWTFTDLTLFSVLTDPVDYPLVGVEAGTPLTQVRFTGRQTWVGGNGAFELDSTTDSGGIIEMLKFENIRWEGHITQTRPGFSVMPHANTTGGVTFDGCWGTLETGTGTLIKVRNVGRLSMRDVRIQGVSGVGTAYDIDDSCSYVQLENVFPDQGLAPSIGSLVELFSMGYRTTTPISSQRVRYLVPSTRGLPDQYLGFGGHGIWAKTATIADGGTIELPPSSSQLGFAQIFVTVDAGSGSDEGGHFLVTEDTSDSASVKLSGTTNSATTPTNDTFSVYRSTGDDTIRLQNDLGESRKFSVFVIFARATAPN